MELSLNEFLRKYIGTTTQIRRVAKQIFSTEFTYQTLKGELSSRICSIQTPNKYETSVNVPKILLCILIVNHITTNLSTLNQQIFSP